MAASLHAICFSDSKNCYFVHRLCVANAMSILILSTIRRVVSCWPFLPEFSDEAHLKQSLDFPSFYLKCRRRLQVKSEVMPRPVPQVDHSCRVVLNKLLAKRMFPY